MKRLIHQIIQWIAACIAAVLLLNLLLFCYNRPAGWIDRTNGATDSIWNPNSFVVLGTEGYGILRIDENGYPNDGFPSEPGYILCVGSSYTQAKEMQRSQSYCSQLNLLLGGTPTNPKVYNVSQDGYFLPRIVKNFLCILSEFPDAGSIIIEVSNTNFDPQELVDALSQSNYDPNSRGEILRNSLSLSERIKIWIKEAFPILSLAKTQSSALAPAETQGGSGSLDREAYSDALDKALSLIRSEFDGDIIIFYHPYVTIQPDGSMQISCNETIKEFEESCKKNSILYLNMYDRFAAEYVSGFHVPYGFNNTTMGTGHLNPAGHRMIAQELFQLIEGGTVE